MDEQDPGWLGSEWGLCLPPLPSPHNPERIPELPVIHKKKKENLPPGSVFSRMILFPWQPSLQGLSNYLPSDKGNVEKAAEG